MILLSTSIL